MKLLRFLTASLCGALLAGCVEWVSLNTEDAPLPVVQCVLQDSDQQLLQLVWTGRNDETELPSPILNAEVTLSVVENDTEREVGKFQRADDGLWRLAYRPVGGQRYQISVTGIDIAVTARTVMPYPIHCETVPNPVLIAFPEKTGAHKYPSRKLVSDGPDESFPALAWISGKDGIREELYTTHPQADSFNNCPDGIWIGYDGAASFSFQPSWSPFHKWMVLFTCAANERNPYHHPLELPLESSSFSLIDLRKTIENHPEYGAFGQDGAIWGPCFDVWPREMEATDTLHLMCPSAELQAYLKSIVSHITSDKSDFTAIFSQESPYTNVVGGKGIFGAVTQWAESLTDYDSRMSDYYHTLYRDELEAQRKK